MGSGQVSDYFPERKDYKETSYGEIARRLCADYLAMGMTLKEYWEGDPDDYVSVRDAHLLRRKQANFDAWLHGFYTYNALQCVSPLFRDWVKDHKPADYFAQPIDLYKSDSQRESERLEDEKELANQATIRAWVEKVNRLKAEKAKKEGSVNG